MGARRKAPSAFLININVQPRAQRAASLVIGGDVIDVAIVIFKARASFRSSRL